MLYHGPFPQEFYRILHGRVHHEFRLRKAWRNHDWNGIIKTPFYLLKMMQTELRLRAISVSSSR